MTHICVTSEFLSMHHYISRLEYILLYSIPVLERRETQKASYIYINVLCIPELGAVLTSWGSSGRRKGAGLRSWGSVSWCCLIGWATKHVERGCSGGHLGEERGASWGRKGGIMGQCIVVFPDWLRGRTRGAWMQRGASGGGKGGGKGGIWRRKW